MEYLKIYIKIYDVNKVLDFIDILDKNSCKYETDDNDDIIITIKDLYIKRKSESLYLLTTLINDKSDKIICGQSIVEDLNILFDDLIDPHIFEFNDNGDPFIIVDFVSMWKGRYNSTTTFGRHQYLKVEDVTDLVATKEYNDNLPPIMPILDNYSDEEVLTTLYYSLISGVFSVNPQLEEKIFKLLNRYHFIRENHPIYYSTLSPFKNT